MSVGNGFSSPDARTLFANACHQIENGDFGLPLAIFADEEIYNAEMKRIFGRVWNFLAHETEIPNSGDFVLRYIGADPILVVRGDNGQVRAFHAICRHRGMQICRAEAGNAERFVCPYHGWAYGSNGGLLGAPESRLIYGETFSRKDWGLLPVAKVEARNGFVFGNLDPKAPSLVDYMGDYAWYFDLYTRITTPGLEVRGKPHRFIVNCNWKMGAENFFGDAYHTMTSHRSVIETGLLPVSGDVNWRKVGIHFNANGVGGGGLGRYPAPMLGYPPEVIEAARSHLSSSHQQVVFDLNFLPISGTMFPNLSFVNGPVVVEEGAPPARFYSFRQWRPIAPDKMEIISWCAVDKVTPEALKRANDRAYTATFGSSGMFEQDDTENWTYVTTAAKGATAANIPLNYRMGLNVDNSPIEQPLSDWPGPGNAYPCTYAEHNQRELWRTWRKYMLNGEAGA
jgi:PAH dioxygenase large subunit